MAKEEKSKSHERHEKLRALPSKERLPDPKPKVVPAPPPPKKDDK